MKNRYLNQKRCPRPDRTNFCPIRVKRIGFVFKTYLTIRSGNLYAKNVLEKKKNDIVIRIRYKRIRE